LEKRLGSLDVAQEVLYLPAQHLGLTGQVVRRTLHLYRRRARILGAFADGTDIAGNLLRAV